MNARVLGSIGVVALVGGGLILAALPSASSAPSSNTIRGFERRSSFNNHRRTTDADDSGGYSQGDIVTSRATLRHNGKSIGKVVDFCGIVDARGPGTIDCNSALTRLAGDTITYSSVVNDDPSPGVVHRAAITGGTGRYARARGTVIMKFGESGVHYIFHVRT